MLFLIMGVGKVKLGIYDAAYKKQSTQRNDEKYYKG